MTPFLFNSSSSHTYSPYPSEDDHHEDHQFSNPNSQALSSSSNSLTTHLFLNSAVVDDQSGTFDRKIQPPQYQQQGDNFGSQQAYNDHSIESSDSKSLEFSTTWGRSTGINDMINTNDQNQMKWMSSKMRAMLKMKKSDPVNIKFYSSATRETTTKHEDHKSPTCYPMEETDNSSNSTSSNNININIPIRVCSDCNTTKTPLWRSGPQGPKSLCNACGIRQRKTRRALAIAAAENGNSNNILGDQSMIMTPLKVTKTQLKDFKKPNNGQVTKYKKRQYSKHIKTTMVTTITPPSPLSSSPSPPPSSSPLSSPSPSPLSSPSSSSLARKNCSVEDFLVNLSKNLTFNYHVFPQDEKEAAILLMAISCGCAHET